MSDYERRVNSSFNAADWKRDMMQLYNMDLKDFNENIGGLLRYRTL